MKKFFPLIIFVLSLLTQNVSAQNTSDNNLHLRFNGIPITGSLNNVQNKLTAKGFRFARKEGDAVEMVGKFANEKCSIVLYATPKTKTIYQIIVDYGKGDSWGLLKSHYLQLKKLLKEKYNVQPFSVEKFIDPYYEGDGYELQATRCSKCLYLSRFTLNNGEITLFISDERVLISYQDKKGNELNEQEVKELSLDDL